jgi:thiol-disulfide isomerase/thioredoxin
MCKLRKFTAAAVLAGLAGTAVLITELPAWAAEDRPVATPARTMEDITRDMQAVGKELQGLMASEEALFDPAKRAEIAPKAVPLLHRMISLFDEQVTLNPEMKPAIADAKADTLLADLTRSENAEHARLAKASQLLVRWWKSPTDPEAQTKAVDELEALAKANPEEDRFESIFTVMAQKGAANEQLKERVAKLAAPKIKALEGQPLTLTGLTVEGKQFSTEQWKGKVILVDFWATWCGPCMQELPRVKKVYKDFHEKGLEILGVSCDRRAEDITGFREKNPDANWTQLFDKDNPGWHPLAKQFGIKGIPTMFLIDKKGVVRTVDARANFEELIPKMLAE